MENASLIVMLITVTNARHSIPVTRVMIRSSSLKTKHNATAQTPHTPSSMRYANVHQVPQNSTIPVSVVMLTTVCNANKLINVRVVMRILFWIQITMHVFAPKHSKSSMNSVFVQRTLLSIMKFVWSVILSTVLSVIQKIIVLLVRRVLSWRAIVLVSVMLPLLCLKTIVICVIQPLTVVFVQGRTIVLSVMIALKLKEVYVVALM